MPHKMKEELERKLKISRMGGGLPDTCDAVGPMLAEEREVICVHYSLDRCMEGERKVELMSTEQAGERGRRRGNVETGGLIENP